MWRKKLTRREQILNNKKLYFNFDNASHTFLSTIIITIKMD